MEDVALNYFNDISNGLGTAVAVLVVSVTIIYAVISYVKKKIAEHDSRIAGEAVETYDENEVKKDLNTLVQTVNQLCTQVNTLEQVQTSHNKDVDKQLKDLSESMTKNEEKSKQGDKELSSHIDSYQKALMDMNGKMDLMISSDTQGIKAFITTQYYIAIEKGYIEKLIMSTIDERYETYLIENGNSFIGGLMKELRALPNKPPEQ